jgi:hypothetical protein
MSNRPEDVTDTVFQTAVSPRSDVCAVKGIDQARAAMMDPLNEPMKDL